MRHYLLFLPGLAAAMASGLSEPFPGAHQARDGAADVRAHGARGDGRTDDTAAFRRALDQAQREQVPIRVPAGRYRITAPLRGFSGFELTGVGPSSEIICHWEQERGTQGWERSLFVFEDGQRGIRFRDVKLRYRGTFSVGGSRESYAGRIAGVYLPAVHSVRFENVEIERFNSYGIHQTTADPRRVATDVEVARSRLHDCRVAGFRFDYVDGCRMLNSDFYRNGHRDDPGTGYGLAGSSGGRPKNVLVRGCRAWHNKRVGIDFHVGENITVEGCLAYGSPRNGLGEQNGIYVGEAFGTIILRNNVLRTFRDRGLPRAYLVRGIHAGYPYQGRLNTERVTIRIENNCIQDFDVSGGQQAGYPIVITNSFADLDCAITGCQVDARACTALISFSDQPGDPRQNRVEIAHNRLSADRVDYVPVMLGNVLSARLEDNVLDVRAWARQDLPVFSLGSRARQGTHVTAQGNRVIAPGPQNRSLFADPSRVSGAANVLNGRAAD